ncbi:MAG: M23 family metallopeptidase [Elusimicrobia bacterium]|nr:M23 family metallopeptidase [Elusimicrobiota bacterium]
MVVPHGTTRPHQFSFSLPFIMFLLVCWTGLTGWATYVASQRFDYWRIKANSHLLRIKLDYYASQMKRSREMLDDMKELDNQLRALLNLGSREAIVQSEDTPLEGAGGPTALDAMELQRVLDGRATDLTLQDISRQMNLLRSEVERRMASFQDLTSKIEEQRHLFRSTPNTWPTNGYVTSHFGFRASPFTGDRDWHRGVDIAGPPGAPVRATADGVVTLAGWAGGYGKIVVIEHDFGYSTRYGHNRQILVKRGDKVKRGQIISLIGSTGNATGPHCHYEIWQYGRVVDPRRFLAKKI